MPRPRFAKLAQEKKDQILQAAAEEFGRYGFEAASINKIIERAGISKGAAYYYFNDKGDLYVTVLRYAMELYEKWTLGSGALDLESVEADEFWDTLNDLGIRGVLLLKAHPWMVRLFRGFFTHVSPHGGEDPRLDALWSVARSQTEAWFTRGQELGVMRSDLPMGLFVDVSFGMGMALDRWLFEHIEELEGEALEEAVLMMTDMFRRIAEPRAKQEER